MKLSIGNCKQKVQIPHDLVQSALEAHEALESMRSAELDCAELDVCIENLMLVQNSVAEYGLEGLKSIDVDGSIESFIGRAESAEAALEGIGQKIKDAFAVAFDKIREWIRRFIDWIRSFFSNKKKMSEKIVKQAEQTKVVDDFVKKEASSGAKEVPADKVPEPVKEAVKEVAPKLFKSSGVVALPYYKTVEDYYNEETINTLDGYSLPKMVANYDLATTTIKDAIEKFEGVGMKNIIQLLESSSVEAFIDAVGKGHGFDHDSGVEVVKAAFKKDRISLLNTFKSKFGEVYRVDFNYEPKKHTVKDLCPFAQVNDMCAKASKIHPGNFENFEALPDELEKFYAALDKCHAKLTEEIKKESEDSSFHSKYRVIIQILHEVAMSRHTLVSCLTRVANSVEMAYREVHFCYREALAKASGKKED